MRNWKKKKSPERRNFVGSVAKSSPPVSSWDILSSRFGPSSLQVRFIRYLIFTGCRHRFLIGVPSISAQEVPSKEDLSRLQATADENNATLGPLISQLNALQADIRRIATEIAYAPQSDRERVLMQLEESGQDDTSAVNGAINGEKDDVFDVEEQIKRIIAMRKGAQPNEADLEVCRVFPGRVTCSWIQQTLNSVRLKHASRDKGIWQ